MDTEGMTPDDWSTDSSLIPQPAAESHGPHIFGFVPDESRTAVPSNDPFHRCVVQVSGFRSGESSPRTVGTGILFAPDRLITAAHVIFNPYNNAFGTRGYAHHVRVGSPLLSIPATAIRSQRFVAALGYTSRRDPAFDLAVIRLEAAIPQAEGPEPLAPSDDHLENAQLMIYGFPEFASGLYRGRGRCVGIRPGLLFHTADASEGQSGGPVAIRNGGEVRLIGLHRAGPGETPSGIRPSCGAVRLTAQSIGWITEMGEKL